MNNTLKHLIEIHRIDFKSIVFLWCADHQSGQHTTTFQSNIITIFGKLYYPSFYYLFIIIIFYLSFILEPKTHGVACSLTRVRAQCLFKRLQIKSWISPFLRYAHFFLGVLLYVACHLYWKSLGVIKPVGSQPEIRSRQLPTLSSIPHGLERLPTCPEMAPW